MIHEHSLGTTSRWSPYLDILPTEFDTLMFWSEAELQDLAGSAVVDKIGKASAETTFAELILPVVKAHLDVRLEDDEIVALAHRFGSTIMAYAFDLEKHTAAPTMRAENEEWEEDDEDTMVLPKGMVPLADMLNADADRNNAKLFYRDDVVSMRSTKRIEAGEEVFNDYGPLPRADLLRRYGYLTENYAKYDVVEVSIKLIAAIAKQVSRISEKDLAERTAYLEGHGVLDDGYDVARPENEDGQFGDEFKILLNTLVLSPADFAKLQSKDKLPSPDLSKPATELLYAVLVHRRAAYPNGPTAGSAHPVNEYRNNMAKQVVEGETKTLRLAAEVVQRLIFGGEGRKRKAVTFEEEAMALKR